MALAFFVGGLFFNQLTRTTVIVLAIALFVSFVLLLSDIAPRHVSKKNLKVCQWIAVPIISAIASGALAWYPWAHLPHAYMNIEWLRLHPIEVPPYVEFGYHSSGQIPVESFVIVPKMYFRAVSPNDQKAIDQMYGEFENDFANAGADLPWHRSGMEPDAHKIDTQSIPGLPLTDSEINELLQGVSKYAFAMGGIQFTDAGGTHRKGFCFFMVPPSNHILFRQHNPTDAFGNWQECYPSDMRKWEESAP